MKEKIMNLIAEHGEEAVREALEEMKRKRLQRTIAEYGEELVAETLEEMTRKRYEEALNYYFSASRMHACKEAEA